MSPPTTIGPTGCRWNSKLDTTPKFPPPPRKPHSSSGSSEPLARTIDPSAVTTSAADRLSAARPCLRINQPIPPPRVSPATPVWEIRPPVLARPCACVAASKSAQVAPGWAVAVRVSGSTTTSRISERSSITPSSHALSPARLCPPPRTANGGPLSRAKRTTSTMSSVVRHRAITAGRLSNAPFQSARTSSYVSSPGMITSPANLVRNASNAPPVLAIGLLLTR